MSTKTYRGGCHCGKVTLEADLGLSQVPETGGDCAAVNLACLDDLDPAELVAAPVELEDGKARSWWSTPAETRHVEIWLWMGMGAARLHRPC